MAVGGGPSDVTCTGLLRNNSIIGGNAAKIRQTILDMADNVTRIEGTLKVVPPRTPRKRG
jgi:hypothetical protein